MRLSCSNLNQGELIIEQKNSYTIKTAMGYEIEVIRMSKEDVAEKLAEFEAKYGMTSKEFITKYNSCQFEEENLEFMDWVWYYDAAADFGMVSLELGK